MTAFWKKSSERPTRHSDPDAAVAKYLEQLHQADVAGASPPASALNGLGDAYLDKGDVASAVDYYRQAAEEYAREGMHTNAIACLKKVRRHADEEGDTGLLLGRYYAAKKLVPDALAELEAYADRQQRMGYGKRALEAIREVVRLVPDDAAHRERLGDLLREEGQDAAALGAYREAMTRYRSAGAEAGARRVGQRIEALGGEVHPPGVEPPAGATPSPAPVDAGELEEPARRDDPAAAAPGKPGGLADEPGPLNRPAAEEPDEPADDAGGVPPAEPGNLSMELEIERTSYVDEPDEGQDEPAFEIVHDLPEDLPPVPNDEEEDALTIAQQNFGTGEPVPRVEIESSAVPEEPGADEDRAAAGEDGTGVEEDREERLELPDVPNLAAAADELTRAADEMDRPAARSRDAGIVPEPRSHADLLALAEQHVRTGDSEQAGRYLLLAAEGLREEREWKDAAHAYRRLAEIGEARAEDLEDWVECARQTGRAHAVLEALATASRWHLDRGDARAARRSAEEMFLVDPDSDVAAEILERIGGPSSN